jgi:type IV fimbrial biogenesis protein FimT
MRKPTRFAHSSRVRGASGFTLTELMITILIVAILMAVAAPSFQSIIAGQRIKSATYDMFSTLTFARSEAIKRSANVTVAQASGGWQNGWTVTAGSVTLSQQEAIQGVAIAASAVSVTYRQDGRITAAGSQTFAITSSVSAGVSDRCVTTEVSGLPKSKVGACT